MWPLVNGKLLVKSSVSEQLLVKLLSQSVTCKLSLNYGSKHCSHFSLIKAISFCCVTCLEYVHLSSPLHIFLIFTFLMMKDKYFSVNNVHYVCLLCYVVKAMQFYPISTV
jgi:hypothetical protein